MVFCDKGFCKSITPRGCPKGGARLSSKCFGKRHKHLPQAAIAKSILGKLLCRNELSIGLMGVPANQVAAWASKSSANKKKELSPGNVQQAWFTEGLIFKA